MYISGTNFRLWLATKNACESGFTGVIEGYDSELSRFWQETDRIDWMTWVIKAIYGRYSNEGQSVENLYTCGAIRKKFPFTRISKKIESQIKIYRACVECMEKINEDS